MSGSALLRLAPVVLALACDGGSSTSDPTSSPQSNPDDPVSVPLVDEDGDGIEDPGDNCVASANPDQLDVDADGIGDACDALTDVDVDGINDNVDNCVAFANPDQSDVDLDGFGDGCDNCPSLSNADQFDDDTDGIGNACPCDTCAPGQWCQVHPDAVAHPAACLDACADDLQGTNGTCCPLGSKWSTDASACLLADVYVEPRRMATSIDIETRTFAPDSCEMVEGCINAPGERRLLRFDTTTPNIGEGDLYLGRPEEVDDVFVYSECHDHYHLETYAQYEVLDGLGGVVAPGHKQAFCLMDFEPWADGVQWSDGQYHCGFQGISTGFADTYDSYLDCQFVDITDVPPGDYRLRVTVNYAHLLAESDYSNNVTEIPVHIPAE
ncbi:MAG: lysyl oxidase family protein [Myxococcota bacterium]